MPHRLHIVEHGVGAAFKKNIYRRTGYANSLLSDHTRARLLDVTTPESTRPNVTDEQRSALEALLAVFMRIGDWPTHVYLEQQLVQLGIELNEALEKMPEALFTPDNRMAAGVIFYQESDKLRLRVRGLSVCRDSEPHQNAFMAALRWAVGARQALFISPNERVEAEWPLSEAIEAMEAELDRSVPLNEIKLVFSLMRDEASLPSWGGNPEDITTWTIHVPREIRRFRLIETLDDYLELTESPPRPSLSSMQQPRPAQPQQESATNLGHPLFGSAERDETFECFVVMPFCEPFETIYREVVKPVCDEVGISCGHVGEIFTPGRIISDVYALITNARVIVAELTDRNPNVFYELGMAHDQGKAVIQLTQEMNDVPFDVRDLRTIVYLWDGTTETADVLREQLRQYLGAALR
jgi:hypothetical protein